MQRRQLQPLHSRELQMALPSKWVVLDASLGEEKKHLYCPDGESVEFFGTNAEALEGARKAIEEGAKMVAVCEIKHVFQAKAIEFREVT